MTKQQPPPSMILTKEAYLQHQERQKIELVLVCLLWFVGCPLLCIWDDSNQQNDSGGSSSKSSMYGQPCQEMCGVKSFSISASMTSPSSKLWGTLMVVWFAAIVIQRTSIGFCGLLKLGLLRRMQDEAQQQQQVQKTKSTKTNPPRTTTMAEEEQELVASSATIADHRSYGGLAGPYQKVWSRVRLVEQLGYLSAIFLIALVAFDALDFMTIHNILATKAFTCLFIQNYVVGHLKVPTHLPQRKTSGPRHDSKKNEIEDPKDNTDHKEERYWTYHRPSNVLYWTALVLYTLLGLGMLGSGTLRNFDKCDQLTFNPQTSTFVGAAFWSIEYIFCMMSIGIQYLTHFEVTLWDWVVCGEDGGEDTSEKTKEEVTGNMIQYAMILPRFSLLGLLEDIFGCMDRLIHRITGYLAIGD